MTVSNTKFCEAAEEAGIELRNLDVNKELSEETWAFTATVYLNGERVAVAKNRGRGGQTGLQKYADNRGGTTTFIDGRDELREVVSELPNVESRIDDEGLEMDSTSGKFSGTFGTTKSCFALPINPKVRSLT